MFPDKTKNVVPQDLQHYRGEAKFLIAYFHFLSLRSYGPTLIIDRLIDQEAMDLAEKEDYLLLSLPCWQ